MQTQNLDALTSQLADLSTYEMLDIHGGESAWYWMSYGAHKTVTAVGDGLSYVYHTLGNATYMDAGIG